MLVFWDQRLAFLATPKTGSTAIAAALEPLAALSVQRPPVLKHTTVHRWHRFLGPYLSAASGGDGFTLVALMREPESWLGSWFRYRQRDDGVDPSKSTRGIGFDQFVRDWCTEPQPPHAAVGSQERFLRPRHGQGVDRLFAYERIGDFVAFLEDRLDCEVILPRLNVSPAGDLGLEPGTRALLRRTAPADFALYDRIRAAA